MNVPDQTSGSLEGNFVLMSTFLNFMSYCTLCFPILRGNMNVDRCLNLVRETVSATVSYYKWRTRIASRLITCVDVK